MSDSVGNDDMRRFGALSDDEVEQVLSGREAADEDLIPLVEFAASLRAEATWTPDETTAVQRVAAAGEAVGESQAARRAESDGPAPLPGRLRRSNVFRTLKPRAAGVLTVVGLLFGATGVAWAANGAVPGEALYSLDTALENFGILNGGAEERLAEARDLVEFGDFAGGLGSAADTVTQSGVDDSSATEALEEAATRASDNGEAAPEQVRESVTALLGYLAANLDDLDGDEVAIMAQAIAVPVPPVPVPPVPVPPVTAPAP